MTNKMKAEKRLLLLESNEGVNLEEILNNNGIKILESECITGGTIIKVEQFFKNELRQEYLLNYEWFDKAEQKKDPLIIEITEETYNKAE